MASKNNEELEIRWPSYDRSLGCLDVVVDFEATRVLQSNNSCMLELLADETTKFLEMVKVFKLRLSNHSML
jgi:hypothetical protein